LEKLTISSTVNTALVTTSVRPNLTVVDHGRFSLPVIGSLALPGPDFEPQLKPDDEIKAVEIVKTRLKPVYLFRRILLFDF